MAETGPADGQLEQLARQASGGNAAAFDALLRQVYPRVRRWAASQVRVPDDADDVAQEVAIRLHRHLPGFQFEARFTTWLYRVTRSVLADWYRRNRRHGYVRERLATAPRPTVDPPDPPLDRQRAGNLVRLWFHDLPARQREVFDLTDLQGHTPAEVAQLLELDPATVRVHLHRARRQLRRRMLAEHPALVEDAREL